MKAGDRFIALILLITPNGKIFAGTEIELFIKHQTSWEVIVEASRGKYFTTALDESLISSCCTPVKILPKYPRASFDNTYMDQAAPQIPMVPKSCECGAEKCGSPRHSKWCVKYSDLDF